MQERKNENIKKNATNLYIEINRAACVVNIYAYDSVTKKYNIPDCNMVIEDLEEKIIKTQKNKKRSIFDRIKQGMSKASEELFDGIK